MMRGLIQKSGYIKPGGGTGSYAEYIAERPRSHGLFTSAKNTNLEKTILKDRNGKRLYGYLKKPVKAQVDAIADELAQLPAVAECYEVWNRLRDEPENYYKDKPRQRLPLSQQKEFKAIKDTVIREAEHIKSAQITFEDEQMDDEQGEEVLNL